MANKQMHPTVLRFREFINDHPKLRKEIRKTGRSWQEFYEKWILLGEEDSFWDEYKEDVESSPEQEENKAEMFQQLLKYAENIDIEKVQKQVHQLSGTIATVQEIIDQYQGVKKTSQQKEEHHPFGWFRD